MQKVHITEKNYVGKSGQFVGTKLIGTDSSTLNAPKSVVMEQANNHLIAADLSDLILRLELNAMLRENNDEMNVSKTNRDYPTVIPSDKKKTPRKSTMMYSRFIPRDRKNHLTLDECMEMIRFLSHQEGQEINSGKFLEGRKNLMKFGNGEIHSRRGTPYFSNSTSLFTNLNIGPDGYGAMITDIARGEATSTDITPFSDLQSHGNLKSSLGSLTRVDIISSISG